MESKKVIYLDNAATTPILPDVKWVMRRALYNYGNASSMHGVGREAKAAVENASCNVAKLIGARPDEMIFTGGGSEANNLFIKGAAAFLSFLSGRGASSRSVPPSLKV